MNIVERIIRPAPHITSRLHDATNRPTPVGLVLANAPKSALSLVLLRFFGRQPNRPWISYRMAKLMAEKMRRKPCRVLEFGSGSSTVWFADRAAVLHSVESNRSWYERISARIAKLPRKRASIEYELRESQTDYAAFREGTPEPYDIILVDGPWRTACLERHARQLAPGGWLYLDNSDADSSTAEPGEMAGAVAFMHRLGDAPGYALTVVTDFAPTALHATQGILVRKAPDIGAVGR